MEIWGIVQVDGKDAWKKEKEGIPKLPLPRRKSLFEWLQDRRMHELTTDEHHPEYWLVFSDHEVRWIERIVAPLAPLKGYKVLQQWLLNGLDGLSMQVMRVSTKTPIAHLDQKTLLAIHVKHRPRPA